MSPTAGAVLLLAFLPLLSIAATYTLSIYLGRYKGNRRTRISKYTDSRSQFFDSFDALDVFVFNASGLRHSY